MLQSGPYYKELSAGYRLTTNNRMELLAVITALEAVKVADADITVYSDSKYVIDSITKGWVSVGSAKGSRIRKTGICGCVTCLCTRGSLPHMCG